MTTKLIIISAIILIAIACKEPSIVGNWKRVNNIAKADKSKVNNDSKAGDLTVSDDSTFFIMGDHSQDVFNSPSWYVCYDISGTWNIADRSLLNLRVRAKKSTYVLSYRVVLLNKKNLLIANGFDRRRNTTNVIKYRRI